MPSGRFALRLASLAGLAVLALVGCATVRPPPPAPPEVPWPQRRAQLQALDPFELTGRVAVAAGTQGFDAHVDWRQEGTRSTVVLDGPLGLGGVHVVADGNRLHVQTSSGQKLTDEEARSELAAKLGFEPPLDSLRYWIVGVPDPARPSEEAVGADERLAGLQQDGWTVDYLAYMSAIGLWLPKRMALTHDGVRVRLVVDRWQP